MVQPRLRAGHCDSVLSGASTVDAARAIADAGRGRWHTGLVPADPAPRSRARVRQRVRAAQAPTPRSAVRIALNALSGVLPATALLEEFRAASGFLVRAKPSRRGLRGNIRGVAHARQRLAHALPGLGRAAEARIHGRAHGGRRRASAGATHASTRGAARASADHAAETLRTK